MKNTKTDSNKKRKIASKKKTTDPAKKKKPVTKKVVSAAGKKAKGPAEAKKKSPAKKYVKKTASGKQKRTTSKKTKIPVKAPAVEENITRGEDLHLIPVAGEIQHIGSDEANHLETLFQNREKVTLHQENRKVNDALGSRKNLIKYIRVPRNKGK